MPPIIQPAAATVVILELLTKLYQGSLRALIVIKKLSVKITQLYPMCTKEMELEGAQLLWQIITNLTFKISQIL